MIMMPIIYLMDLSRRLDDLQVPHFIANFTDRGNNVRDLIIKGTNCTYIIDMIDDHIRKIELISKTYSEMLEWALYDGIDRLIYDGENTLNNLDELSNTH